MSWLYVLGLLVTAFCVWLAHVWIDVQQRKRRLERTGLQVVSQLFYYTNMAINVLPKSGFFKWLFPLRFGLEEDVRNYFKQFKSDCFGFVSYGYQEFLTIDPKLIKEVAITRRQEFDKPYEPYHIVRLFGENIVTALETGGEWKKHRTIVGPAFSEGNNALVADSTVKALNHIMAEWEKSKEGELKVDLDGEMVRLALCVIGAAGMGIDLTAAVNPVPARNGVMHKLSLRDALQGVVKHLLARLLMPKPLLALPFGIFKEVRECYDEFQVYMKDFCEERREKKDLEGTKNEKGSEEEKIPKKSEEELRKDRKRADLLTLLLANNTVLTDEEIFGDIFIFLVAGHETTAHTLGWALRLLALYPEIQEKLYEETKAVLGDRQPTYEDYESLVYARCVFREALRLFPQVGGVPKFCIEGTNLGGYDLPPKTELTLCVTALLKDERHWDKPEEFIPERFDNRLPGYKSQDPYVYIPFSVGRRTCLGTKFAQVEGSIALSLLSRAYKFEVPKGVTREYLLDKVVLLTLQPKNSVELILKKRK